MSFLKKFSNGEGASDKHVTLSRCAKHVVALHGHAETSLV